MKLRAYNLLSSNIFLEWFVRKWVRFTLAWGPKNPNLSSTILTLISTTISPLQTLILLPFCVRKIICIYWGLIRKNRLSNVERKSEGALAKMYLMQRAKVLICQDYEVIFESSILQFDLFGRSLLFRFPALYIISGHIGLLGLDFPYWQSFHLSPLSLISWFWEVRKLLHFFQIWNSLWFSPHVFHMDSQNLDLTTI